jgi:hypothetical protein
MSKGKRAALVAALNGEIRVEDIPLNPGIDIGALKAGDASPLEVVVEVPAGKSTRGWNYRPQALQDIVGEVMTQGLPGVLGHQKVENIESEFPTPVTHWVGAKFDPEAPVTDKAGKVIGKGKAYFRGVIDQAAADLKRWIRAKTIRTVSIFGMPKLQQVGGEVNVIGYRALSIDWTPLGRAGMPTAIVAMGEMVDLDEISGELDASHEELKEALKSACAANLGGQGYVWVRAVYDDHVVVEHEVNNVTKLYDFPYGMVEGVALLGQKVEVVERRVFTPAGEMQSGKGENMSWKEQVAAIKAALASGEVTRAQVVGEMGLTGREILGEIDAEYATQASGAIETLGKVKEVLGVSGEMDVVEAAKTAGAAVTAQAKADHEKLVTGVLEEKVAGEMAQALVRKMLQVPEGATKEQVAGEIDRVLGDEAVKTTLSRLHLDQPAPKGTAGGDAAQGDLVTKRVPI